MNFVAYGAEVEIDPGELSRFYLLQWPVRGAAQVRCGAERAEVGAGICASLLSPTLPTRMIWREGCEKVIALVERERVARQWEALTGEPARAVEFAVGVPMTTGAGPHLSRHLELMVSSAESGAPAPYQTLLCDALTALLLTSLPHDRSAALAAAPREAGPSAVRRAEAYIEAHIASTMSAADIAGAAQVPLRSLQSAFRKARRKTLTEHIQERRLDLFRRRLADPHGLATIIDIAYSVGLGHLGRAAAAYKARFGETPRETLRRR